MSGDIIPGGAGKDGGGAPGAPWGPDGEVWPWVPLGDWLLVRMAGLGYSSIVDFTELIEA